MDILRVERLPAVYECDDTDHLGRLATTSRMIATSLGTASVAFQSPWLTP